MSLFSLRKIQGSKPLKHHKNRMLNGESNQPLMPSLSMDSERYIAYGLILLFFIINLFSLAQFPLIHSDETWLKGLSLEVWHQKNFGVTEPFFDLYPRVPHPFRWLFNLLQIGFMGLFGNTLFSARLLSLVASTLSLLIFYKILHLETQLDSRSKSKLSSRSSSKSKLKLESLSRLKLTPYSITGLLLLMLNIQWLYAAHFGRQEALIMLCMLLSYWLCILLKKPRLLALIVLLAIGIHPNSFLIGLMIFALLCYQIYKKRRPIKALFEFTFFLVMGFSAYLGFGFLMAPDFLTRYLSFGASLGVDAVPMSRLQNYYWFWIKLYKQIGGTYELFNIKIELLTLGFLILTIPLVALLKKTFPFINPNWTEHNKHTEHTGFSSSSEKGSSSEKSLLFSQLRFEPYIALMSILLGIFIIGRNNQTSVVFLLPFLVLMVLNLLPKLYFTKWVSVVLILFALLNLQSDLKEYAMRFPYAESYERTQAKITAAIPKEATILGNINVMEGFNPNRFYDIRNLAYLEVNHLTLQDYIRERHIDYIIIHDEMDYIASCSPKWDFLYDNMTYWDELKTYLSTHTELVAEIDNPLYAMRISKYAGTYPWQTKIYRILP
ncbi:ArnT family glycosyltransferase [Fusibacter ferrireducens]|uniref:Glycosyltransferase RgtA/B/C/D-like domain-containing protein n=1 Tax=Fusibacter ferrireducens TaxID=2785058 RepID=A0ABR9ZXU7_9FIRM|nr:hypothetical protein [Fusibacter ferrireducens]MBF4695279.1 hypothetical protein [Fusibacter ferrireducens]